MPDRTPIQTRELMVLALGLLERHSEGGSLNVDPDRLSEALCITPLSYRQYLSSLRKAGMIKKAGRGDGVCGNVLTGEGWNEYSRVGSELRGIELIPLPMRTTTGRLASLKLT